MTTCHQYANSFTFFIFVCCFDSGFAIHLGCYICSWLNIIVWIVRLLVAIVISSTYCFGFAQWFKFTTSDPHCGMPEQILQVTTVDTKWEIKMMKQRFNRSD